MILSKSFFTTLKNVKDEDSISAELLVKAGFIKRNSSGVYIILPLGLKTLKKIENIIRKEMNAINSVELLMPILIPEETYINSGRRDLFGDDMFSLDDKSGKKYVLGPTHEELFVEIAKTAVKSYKDLPLSLYQIQTKFRDETRSRYGLIRVREFLMKDAYTFDKTLEDLDDSYLLMKKAYYNIFETIGIDFAVVKAGTGAMGGLLSEEFQAVTDIGEDKLVVCENCDFASNIEMVDEDISKCPNCDHEITFKKGIEVGNIFKLGTKYSDKLNLKYSNSDNSMNSVYMGCYGIGVGRILASYVEQNNDEYGLKFNDTITPYKLAIINLDVKDEEKCEFALNLYNKYKHTEEVILDDRNISVGNKLSDIDLIGVSHQIIIGKNYHDGHVEIKNRFTGEKSLLKIEELDSFIESLSL